MNIFCFDSSPIIAAKMNCSKHVVKMVLELSQILSTAHRVLDGKLVIGLSKSGRSQKQYLHSQEFLHKAVYVNHPSAIYCRESAQQYTWAAAHLQALCKEYTFRYGKIHKVELEGLVHWLVSNVPKNIGLRKIFSLPTPAMPEDCIIKIGSVVDVVASYRNYMCKNKRHLADWSGKVNSREVPHWYK